MESILATMGTRGRRTQRAWDLMRRYATRHPRGITRQQLLQCALLDPARDIFTDEDSDAVEILGALGHSFDADMANHVKLLLPTVRATCAVPDYWTICCLTNVSSKNRARKQTLWNACAEYLAHYVATTTERSSSL